MDTSHTLSQRPVRPLSHAAEQEIRALLKYGFIFEQQPDGLHMKHAVMGFDVVLPAAHITAKENVPALNDLLASYHAAVKQPTPYEQDFADRMQPDWREHMPPAERLNTPRTQMFVGVCAARGLALLARIKQCEGITVECETQAGVATAYVMKDAQEKRGLSAHFGQDGSRPIVLGLKHGRIHKPSVKRLELLLQALLQREGMPTDAEPLLQPEQRIDALADRLLLEQGRVRAG